MKQLSIKDIAKLAGVAPSTVSFVINGKEKEMRISPAMVRHINAIIKKTGYIPNRAAVSLRTGKTHVIGLIIEDIANSFFASLAKSVEHAAARMGYRVLYGSTENDDKRGNDLIKLLYKQVDGFLIAPSAGMKSGLTVLKKNRKPTVLVDRYFADTPIPYVMIDNYAGIKMAVEHLIAKGRNKIAFVNVALDQQHMQEREKAYVDTIKKHKLYDKKLILRLPYFQDSMEYDDYIRGFLQKNSANMDAIIFGTNYLGMHGIKAIKDLKLNIPKDVAVISFDDTDLFRFTSPAISVIDQPISLIAENAVQFLLNQINNTTENSIADTLLIPPKIILRKSV